LSALNKTRTSVSSLAGAPSLGSRWSRGPIGVARPSRFVEDPVDSDPLGGANGGDGRISLPRCGARPDQDQGSHGGGEPTHSD
jgi:hypothetical protein